MDIEPDGSSQDKEKQPIPSTDYRILEIPPLLGGCPSQPLYCAILY